MAFGVHLWATVPVQFSLLKHVTCFPSNAALFWTCVSEKNLSDGNPMVIAMLSISQFFLFEACFQKGFVNFRDQLVWTVHLTVEIKLCFQIPPS